MQRLRRSLAAFLVLLFVVPACARPSRESAALDRTVNVFMRDDNTYDPPEIGVSAGETVAFEVINEGNLVHELLIGDEEEQLRYAEQMEHGGHEGHGSSVPGVVVEPGQRKTFTYVIPPNKGRLYFGCHEPGHYEAGMHGELKYRP